MKTLWLKLAPLLAALLFAAGCHSGTAMGDVTVNVTDIRPVGAAQENQAELTLRYVNGNVFAIALSRTTHTLYLNNDYVGKVESNDPLGLPQVGTNTQKVTLTLENPALLQKLRDAASPKVISYRLDSTLAFEVSDDWKKIKTSSTGQLDIGALLGTAGPNR